METQEYRADLKTPLESGPDPLPAVSPGPGSVHLSAAISVQLCMAGNTSVVPRKRCMSVLRNWSKYFCFTFEPCARHLLSGAGSSDKVRRAATPRSACDSSVRRRPRCGNGSSIFAESGSAHGLSVCLRELRVGLDGNEYAVPGSHAVLQVSRQQGPGGGLGDGCGEAGTMTVP